MDHRASRAGLGHGGATSLLTTPGVALTSCLPSSAKASSIVAGPAAAARPDPHGLRHGHQTWLDELGVRYVIQSERMGHEVPGMRGACTHITQRMCAELRDGLQELWEASLDERTQLVERSAVGILDDLLRADGR